MRSSCVRQPPRVHELFRAGCAMKVMKMSGKGFPIMHVKSLIFDEKVVLTGSPNMTHNAMENNKEHLYRIAVPRIVSQVLDDFEKDWEVAEDVTREMVDSMYETYLKEEEKKRAEKERRGGRSASASLSRDVSRSLSQELDEAAKPDENRLSM